MGRYRATVIFEGHGVDSAKLQTVIDDLFIMLNVPPFFEKD